MRGHSIEGIAYLSGFARAARQGSPCLSSFQGNVLEPGISQSRRSMKGKREWNQTRVFLLSKINVRGDIIYKISPKSVKNV